MTPPCLHDPKVFPSDRVLVGHLGKRADLWGAFTDLVGTADAALALEWRYYRDGKSWLGKVTRKKKTMCWISIWPGMFRVTFYFGSRNDAAVARAKIAPRLKRAFTASKGKTFRGLTVEVRTKSALHDVVELLRLRESVS